MEERESKDLISASLLTSIDFSRKFPEQFRLWMSNWTHSDCEKENYDDFEPPEKCQKRKLPSISKGFVPPKYGKEYRMGSFNFSAVNCCRKFNERSSLGENIGVDILSRPVDKDSNCTKICCVLCLLVVPLTIHLFCHQPSLVKHNQCASVLPCIDLGQC